MKDNEIIKGCGEVCGDNRFDLIEKYKKQLIDSTNIESSKDEMAVIDNVLFRCWQMKWLDRLEEYDRQKAEIAKLEKVEKYADETIKAQAAEIERLEKARQKQAQFLGEERGQKYELLNKIADITKNINFAIQATNLNSDYDVGLRNGLRLALSFIDSKEPQYESCGGKDEK